MLENVERCVAELEAALRAIPSDPSALPPTEETVMDYVRDLRGTLETDVLQARELQTIRRSLGGSSITSEPGSPHCSEGNGSNSWNRSRMHWRPRFRFVT